MKNSKNIIFLSFFLLFLSISCKKKNSDIGGIELRAFIEDSIRKSLHIPDDAKHVLILSHAAHMDWDWLNTFPYNVDKTGTVYRQGYFRSKRQPGDSILTYATQNLKDPEYYYSVCEMAFLKAFAKDKPTLFDQMKSSKRMRVVGGGITSPDNLLPNGETFFRNFLVANQWLDEVNVPWTQQVWIPDDFGHDPQLPVMLNAMDAMGVGFSRIPGGCYGGNQDFRIPATTLLDTIEGGVDFMWKSSDGSKVIAHWLEDHYNQGTDIDTLGGDYVSPEAIKVCTPKVNSNTPQGHIRSYIGANKPVSPTPYIYVQVSDDFMIPYQKIVKDAKLWNSDPMGYSKTGVYAVVATFDQYTRLINSHSDKLKTRTYNSPSNQTQIDSFSPNPYWMGFYASRPELKILHHKATKSLLGAETFQVMANRLLATNTIEKRTESEALYSAWNTLVPSTHHDYITGTAVDGVYLNEQLPLLKEALKQGNDLRSSFMHSVTKNLPPAASQVAVFNQLGMDNSGVIEYSPSTRDTTYINVKAPSMGYMVNNLTTASKGDGNLKMKILPNGYYSFENSLLNAIFDNKNGNLINLVDKSTFRDILSGTGNEIEFYKDTGNIYRFGYEHPDCIFKKVTEATFTIESITLDTKNPLNKSIKVRREYTIEGNHFPYTITYSLRQGEPYLRIVTEGKAPSYYTVMVKFPLQSTIQSMDIGTPYHWNKVYPMDYGSNKGFNATMWATHDFVVPNANEVPLAAIYHSATPAWTSDKNILYGVILRDTPGGGCENQGANGSDKGTHIQTYALRVPSRIPSPQSGKLLKEARRYNTPMHAIPVPSNGGGGLPSTYSLASTTESLITSAKWSYADPNDLILRLYQASNKPFSEIVTVSEKPSKCDIVTALEKPFKNSTDIPSCSTTSNTVRVTMPNAIASVKLEY